ncbi:uncharacterized protein [Mytilus edulis]|uniref:uncharacterized protein isoform X1 n=2 Tax=Mytilus edulis TaxID=6550 RepID=UPI0039EEEA3D
MWSQMLILLVLISVVSCQGDVWEELFSVNSLEPVSLDVYSEIPGNIKWQQSNRSTALTAKAKIYQKGTEDLPSELPSSQCRIDTEIKSGKITVRIFPKIQEPKFTSYQLNGGFPLLYSYFLTLCILGSVHGWRIAVTYGVLLSAVFTFANVSLSNITRIDIVVEYPETVQFKKINVFMKNGNITLPESITHNSIVDCSTDHTYNRSGCISCCHGKGVCGIGNKCYCKEGHEERTHCKMKKIPRHTIFINTVDQRIIHVNLPTNQNITVYGKKDMNGSVKSLKSFRSNDQYGVSSNIIMGKLRKISRIVSSSGTTISFDWKTKCSVHVTVIFNKGQGQIDQDITVCKIKPKHKKVEIEDNKETQNILPSSVDEKRNMQRRSKNVIHHHHKGDFIKIPVEIKSCNEPDSSAEVFAKITAANHSENIIQNHFLGSLTSYPGLYHIRIPVKPVHRTESQESTVCQTFIHSANHLCKYASSNYYKFQRHICKQIKSSIKVMSGVSFSQVSDVITTCESSFQTVLSFCKEFYTNIDNNCNRDSIKFYDSFVSGNVSVQIIATFPGNYSVHSKRFDLKVKEDSPYSVTMKKINDIRPKPRFIGFSVNPRDPKAFQRYNVKINYACASSTTKLDMRIEGSDNYHSNITCYGVTQCNCCILHVAGAAAHVMDKVLVTLNDPLTQTITTREIAVLF